MIRCDPAPRNNPNLRFPPRRGRERAHAPACHARLTVGALFEFQFARIHMHYRDERSAKLGRHVGGNFGERIGADRLRVEFGWRALPGGRSFRGRGVSEPRLNGVVIAGS